MPTVAELEKKFPVVKRQFHGTSPLEIENVGFCQWRKQFNACNVDLSTNSFNYVRDVHVDQQIIANRDFSLSFAICDPTKHERGVGALKSVV